MNKILLIKSEKLQNPMDAIKPCYRKKYKH